VFLNLSRRQKTGAAAHVYKPPTENAMPREAEHRRREPSEHEPLEEAVALVEVCVAREIDARRPPRTVKPADRPTTHGMCSWNRSGVIFATPVFRLIESH
jgi:hypothetical protein